jgi:sigma-B regulation protein RsbU (phosphoserine phosphatase)
MKSLVFQYLSPAEVSTRLNRVLYSNIPLHKFITAFYGVVNIPRRTLTYTNAGHNPPLVVHADGECVRLDAGGSVLGAFEDLDYEQGEIQLSAGDRVLLFTDGLSEAVDENNEQFGEQRLCDLLCEHRHRTPEELKDIVFDAVDEFCGRNFCDDVALMIVAVA